MTEWVAVLIRVAGLVRVAVVRCTAAWVSVDGGLDLGQELKPPLLSMSELQPPNARPPSAAGPCQGPRSGVQRHRRPATGRSLFSAPIASRRVRPAAGHLRRGIAGACLLYVRAANSASQPGGVGGGKGGLKIGV